MLAAILGLIGVSSICVLVRLTGVVGIRRFYSDQGENGLWAYHVPTRAVASLLVLLYFLTILVAVREPDLFRQALDAALAALWPDSAAP